MEPEKISAGSSYLRNGFRETGFFAFYDDTEFDIGAFEELTVCLSEPVSDHIPKPYRKAE